VVDIGGDCGRVTQLRLIGADVWPPQFRLFSVFSKLSVGQAALATPLTAFQYELIRLDPDPKSEIFAPSV
jgi:hypothetical protein